MKFSTKILLCTITIMAVALGLSGSYLVDYVFRISLEREISQAMDESSILQFAFKTAALNVPSRYDVLPDTAVERIGSNLENGGQAGKRQLRISDENRNFLFASDGFTEESRLLDGIEENKRLYQVTKIQDRYYVHTGIRIQVLNRVLYLETMKDVTEVFRERMLGFDMYRKVTFLVLFFASGVLLVVCLCLTRPIMLLKKATGKMAQGEYSYRAQVISADELGDLTRAFNQMAEALEETIGKLEEEIRSRETFIAAFAHELKTPLTSIIGYADILRSRKLEEEKHFLASNYVYTEGKRLEAMSLRLLDIIVMKQGNCIRQEIEAEKIFSYLQDLYGKREEYRFTFSYEPGWVYGEENLLKSVLLNLVDNACKASSPGSEIVLSGTKEKGGYRFCVTDFGIGIPEEEIGKITEAFYMVDKSRSRSCNGAGLGLALCTEILKLHDSGLQIESTLGKGTSISFVISGKQPEKKPGDRNTECV